MAKVTTDDVAKALRLLGDLKAKATDASKHIQDLLQQVEDGQMSTAKGVSFLEVKYQLLLSYLMNLTYLMHQKIGGKSIQGSSAIGRMVEIRTVLEKMRPIDQKLKYQIDKLVKTATTGLDENNPLRFKPRPENLESKLEEDSGSDSEEDGDDEEKSKVYRPPKLAAMHYDGDATQQELSERHLERAKKRALSSSIIRELRDEYYEGPEEVKEHDNRHKARAAKFQQERKEYEEKNFTRLSLTRKQKADLRRSSRMTGLEGLTNFGDISALTQGEGGDMEDDGQPTKRRKISGKKTKGKGKKKGFRKRRM